MTDGKYNRRLYCDNCLYLVKRISGNTTKEELLNKYSKFDVRNIISRDARRRYDESGKQKKCCVCDYDKHIDIAHIKAVSDFNDSATLDDINNIDNITGLCPNHHWEFDHELLDNDIQIN